MKRIMVVLILLFPLTNSAYAVHPHVSYVTTPTWMTIEDVNRDVEPRITFVRHFKYTYTPSGGTEETTVDALDLNGVNIFLANPGKTLITIPIIKLGGQEGINLTVLKQSFLTGDNKRLIVQLPPNVLPGSHSIFIQSYTGSFMQFSFTATLLPDPPETIAPKSVILFSGAINTIPSGWQLCDGTNSTPNLKNKFVVGAGSTYAVGATGGRATIANHRLTIAQIPSHNHSYRAGGSSSQNVKMDNDVNVVQGLGNRTTGNKGGGGVHNHGDNRPPYHAL